MEAEGSEKQGSQPLDSSYFYQCSDQRGLRILRLLLSLQPQTMSVSMNLQTALSCCLLPTYIPSLPIHITFFLHLPSAGIKGIPSQVLGSPLVEFCFSFRQG